MQISIIITTYNWPAALELVVAAFADQTIQNFELLIADDGSRTETAEAIQSMQCRYSFPISHVWQPDDGFRAAQIRNKAAARSQGEYLIFIDGDSIPLPTFVENHQKLAEMGYWVPGPRVLLSQAFTQQVLAEKIPLYRWTFRQFRQARADKKINRIKPLIPFPLGILRKCTPNRWKNAKTCNLAVWKSDFLAMNGFDESYCGWGYEDSDLVIRLIKAGIKRKSSQFAVPVLHLWHQESDRSGKNRNYQKLMGVLAGKGSPVTQGVSQYL